MKPLFLPVLVLATVLQSAPAQQPPGIPDPAAAMQKLGSGVNWIVDDPQLIPEGNRTRKGTAELSASRKKHRSFDRLGALAEARAEAQATKRLILWYIPQIIGRQMYRPALPDLYMRAVVFSEPACVDIVNRRFVPVRLICDRKLQQATGITAPDMVEPAIVFLKPDGTIVHRVDRIRTFNALWFMRVLRHVLAENTEFASPVRPPAKAGSRQKSDPDLLAGEEYLRDGDWEKAEALLSKVATKVKGETGVRASIRLASAHRYQGRTKQALTVLEQAEKRLPKQAPQPRRSRRSRGSSLEMDIACERGRAHLLAGDLEAARDAFAACRRGARRVEALFHLGLVQWMQGSDTGARRSWKMAFMANDRNPYAWRAAANLVDGPDLTPLGPTMHGFEDPFLPRKPHVAVTDTTAPVAPEKARDLARDALKVLLRLQRDHGGWTDGRYAYWSSPDLTPNVWVTATAMACAALLDWRELDPEAVDAALERGERYMFDESHMARGFNEEIYAEASKLQYLVRRYDKRSGSKERAYTIKRMNEAVQSLKRIQNDRGFWAHEYPNPFCTAAVMSALKRAKERGAGVPRPMLLLGAKALVSCRGKDGSYSYGSGGRSSLKDSMGRAPICDSAILWSGDKSGSPENVGAAMENFWKYLPRLERIRKCDFHTDGELGGFFFWHAVFHTTEAIDAAPAKTREKHRQAMLQHVLKIGEFDGSFIDSHEFGKSYGTAMALMTLKLALQGKEP